MKKSKEELENILREAGFRITEHRLALFKAVATSRQPLTVYTLCDMLRKKYDIDQSTVYRNLSSLHDAGLLRRLDYNHGHAHYELETGKSTLEIVCSRCETVEKLDAGSMGPIFKKIGEKSKRFKKTTSYTVEIYGLCKNCS
jgi:Fe2+ or Zn2+ uptake regulation protein